MKATLIAIASLLVVAGVALVLLMSSTDATPPTPRARSAAGSAGVAVAPTTSTDRPSLPAPPPSLVATSGSGYAIGDTKLRDHRSGSNAPRDIPPNPHPANARDLPSELTHAISQQVKNQIYACAAAVPKDAKGDKPKVIGQLNVAIKDHMLAITGMALETRDISDPAAATALTQCAQEKTAGFTSPAKDQADLADYNIQVNFAIP
ncbi:MAG: hypothetical protein ABI591_32015 [Kofleriaceae bacterium]